MNRATETTVTRDLSPTSPCWIPSTTLSSSFSRDTKAIVGSNNRKWNIQRSTSRRLSQPNSVDTLVGSKGFTSGVHYWEWKVINGGSYVFGLLNSIDGCELRGSALRGYLGNPSSAVNMMKEAVGLSTVTHEMAKSMNYELSSDICHWYEVTDDEEVRRAWNVITETSNWGPALSSQSLKRMIGDNYILCNDSFANWAGYSLRERLYFQSLNHQWCAMRYATDESYNYWLTHGVYNSKSVGHTIPADTCQRIIDNDYSRFEGAAGYTFGILLDFNYGEAVMYIYAPSPENAGTREPIQVLSLGTLFQDGRKYYPAVSMFGSNGRLELDTEAPFPTSVSASYERYRTMMEANIELENEVRDLRNRLDRLARGLSERTTASSNIPV